MIKDVYLLTKNNKTMESTQKRSHRHSYLRHAPTGKRRKRSRGPEFKWAHWIYAHIDLNIMLHNQRADSSRSLDEGHQSVHTYPCLKTVKRGLTGNGWDTTGCKSHSSFPPTLPKKKETSSSSFKHLVSASTVHSRGAHDSNVAAQTNRKLLILDHIIICFIFITKHHAVRIKSGHVVGSGFRHKHGL